MVGQEFSATLLQSLSLSLAKLGEAIISTLPNYFIALVILIAGYILGKLLGKTTQILLSQVLNIDGWLKRKKLEQAFYKVKISNLFSGMVKWYVYVLFLAQAVSFINLPILSSFVELLLAYLPKLFGAVIIFVLSFFVGELVKIELGKTVFPYKKQAGSAAKFLIIYIALVISLQTAGFNVEILIEVLRVGLLGVAIAGGIAIGITLGLAYQKEILSLVKPVKKRKK